MGVAHDGDIMTANSIWRGGVSPEGWIGLRGRVIES